MRSTAQIKGHPIHPILVCFPIAFYIGTFVFDILAVTSDTAFLHTAWYLNICALITAVVAAIPGAIDYFKTIPPGSSAKKRGTQHALINVTVLLLFAIGFIIRLASDDIPPSTVLILIEAVGVILLFIAGWMGGTLVYRNQIGVDIRYAHAGKWKEDRIDSHEGEVEVATADELKINQMKLIHIRDRRVVLGRTEDGYAAFSDFCTHRGGSLAGGSMMCGTVQCPWHGSQFSVKDGTVKAGPAKMPIAVYPVVERNGKVFVLIS